MRNILEMVIILGLILLYTQDLKGMSVLNINEDSNHHSIKKKIISNAFQLVRDPWLDPKEGVLASTKTKIYELSYDAYKNLQYKEIKNAINIISERSDQLRKAGIWKSSRGRPKQNAYNGEYEEGTKTTSTDGRPDVIYPEVAVVVAYHFYEKFNFDIWTIIPYVLAFWNAVDMRYRNLENPKYRFYIPHIILETDPNALQFMTFHDANSNYLTAKTIFKARHFWYAQNASIPLDTYDLVAVMSSHLLCGLLNSENHECNNRIYGQAWPFGACSIDHDKNEIAKIAIIHDNGAYDGITIAAHEIGHLLGAFDDGISVYNDTLDDWGPPQCNYEDGYMMSAAVQTSPNIFDWSNCTLQYFENFIDSDTAKCLYNKPKDLEYPIPRFLPGKIINADEQCRLAGAIESCESEISNCLMLQCLYEDRGCTNSSAPAVEGTACGYNYIGRICLHGECVSEYDIV